MKGVNMWLAILSALVVLFVAVAAYAQIPTPPSPELQACQSKLGESLNTELAIRARVFELQRQLADLEANNKKLEKGPEKGPDSSGIR